MQLKMEEHYLNSEKIYYRKNNFLNDRPTLVFIHGLSGSSSAWLPYEKKFERKYNILTFDLRGHGKSFKPRKFEEYSINHFSNDLYKILKKEKVSDIILISHSLGSLIALNFLFHHRKKVRAAILVSPHYAPSKNFSAKLTNIPVWLLRHLTFFSFKKDGEHVDYTNYKNTGDWNLRRMYADISNTGLKSFLNSTTHAYEFDAEDFLSKIKIPILLVHGKKDSIFSIRASEYINSKIKKSRLVILNNADHIIVLNNFEELSSEIEKFVNNLKSSN